MADKIINDLPEVTGIQNNDLFVLQRNTIANKISGKNVIDYVKRQSAASYGAPHVVASSSMMTDRSMVYVYVGNQSGYNNGHWYYHDGSAWVDGGVYNSTAVDTDTSLTVSGKAADARAVGEALNAKPFKNEEVSLDDGVIDNHYIGSNGTYYSSTIMSLKKDIFVPNGCTIIVNANGMGDSVSVISEQSTSGYIPKVLGTHNAVVTYEYTPDHDCYVTVSFNRNSDHSAYVIGYIAKIKSILDSTVLIGNNTIIEDLPDNVLLIGTFVLSSKYTMRPGQVIRGQNAIITVTSSGQIELKNDCIIDSVTFIGNWDPTRTESGNKYAPILTTSDLKNRTNLGGRGQDVSNSLIYCTTSNSEAIKISKCSFKNIDKLAIYINGNAHKSKTGYVISDCYFSDVWNCIGCYGEFGHVSNCLFFRCLIGITVFAGNICKVGNIFKGCDCGLYYISGSNNGAHGETIGCQIAHACLCGIYIKFISANTGEIFSGCHLAEAPVIAEEAHSLIFSGCRLDTYFKIDSGSNNRIVNNLIGTSYLDQNSLYRVPSDTIIRDNSPVHGSDEKDINYYPQCTRVQLQAIAGDTPEGWLYLTEDPILRIVHISGYYRNNGGTKTIPSNTAIFDTIPERLRPKVNYGCPGMLQQSDGTFIYWYITIGLNGNVWQTAVSSSNHGGFFTGIYPI